VRATEAANATQVALDAIISRLDQLSSQVGRIEKMVASGNDAISNGFEGLEQMGADLAGTRTSASALMKRTIYGPVANSRFTDSDVVAGPSSRKRRASNANDSRSVRARAGRISAWEEQSVDPEDAEVEGPVNPEEVEDDSDSEEESGSEGK
jgi:hypothetical protein